MSAIDDVVELLKDGKWHNLKELAKNLQIEQQKLKQIIRFLKNSGFIRLDKKQEKALISSDLKKTIILEH